MTEATLQLLIDQQKLILSEVQMTRELLVTMYDNQREMSDELERLDTAIHHLIKESAR